MQSIQIFEGSEVICQFAWGTRSYTYQTFRQNETTTNTNTLLTMKRDLQNIVQQQWTTPKSELDSSNQTKLIIAVCCIFFGFIGFIIMLVILMTTLNSDAEKQLKANTMAALRQYFSQFQNTKFRVAYTASPVQITYRVPQKVQVSQQVMYQQPVGTHVSPQPVYHSSNPNYVTYTQSPPQMGTFEPIAPQTPQVVDPSMPLLPGNNQNM